MNRLWSDGRWNKLTVAHGCYWKKCSFCDVSLDYISRFEAANASTLVDRVEAIVAETGQTGFHFVDEAAPPKALRALAEELQRRQVEICVVGQHPLRKDLHARTGPAAGRQWLHRDERRPGGGLGPAAGPDEEGRVGGPGGARHQGLCRCRHPGACLPDVRLSRRRPRKTRWTRWSTGAPAVRERLHPQRLLPPLRLHGALTGGLAPGRVRRATAAAAAQPVREERRGLHRPDRAPTTTPWAWA